MAKDIQKFLNYKTSSFEKTARLKDWKEDKKIRVWMHTEVGMEPVWQSNIPKIVSVEKDGETNLMLWGDKLVSHATDEMLKAQWARHPDTKEFKVADEEFGDVIVSLWRWAYRMVDSGELSWVEPLFEFKGKNQIKGKLVDVEKVIHAAGIYGGFKADGMSDEEKKELKDAGVYLTEAWAESFVPKCNCIFAVVDDAEPEKGVQITVQTGLVLQKMQAAISDKMADIGVEDGNPMFHPYAFEWEYDDREKEFGKKYKARAISSLKLTPKVKELITGPGPNIDHLLKPYDVDTVVAFLQKHSVGAGKKIPWKQLVPKKVSRPVSQSEAREEMSGGKTVEQQRAAAPAEEPPKVYKTSTGFEIKESEAVLCEGCGEVDEHEEPTRGVMHVEWNRCVECGKKYDDDGLKDPPLEALKSEDRPRPKEEAKPTRRIVSRSAAKSAAKTCANPPEPKTEDKDPGDEEDPISIPFD